MMQVKRVVMTGGTGFVGANLARKLLAKNYEVHLLVRKQYSDWRIKEIRKQIRLHVINMSDLSQVQRLMRRIKPAFVFHLAAYGAYSWQTDYQTMIRTNVEATVGLINAAIDVGCKAFINTGSSSEYGYYNRATKESDRLEPNSAYAVSKAAATHFCRFLATTQKVYIPTLRLYSAFGPWEDPKRLMPTLITKARLGKLPNLTNPQIARDFVYVDDVCEAFIKATQKRSQEWGPVYNVSSGKQTKLKTLVSMVKKIYHITDNPKWDATPKPWDTTYWRGNNHKIQHELQWKPRHNLKEGLKKMDKWCEEHHYEI